MVCKGGLWSGLYLHHRRWSTYSLYGSRNHSHPVSSVLPTPGIPDPSAKGSPIQCSPLRRFTSRRRLPDTALVPCKAIYRTILSLKGRCSIQLSYGRYGHNLKTGRGREIRTPDILLPKQARYQTALYPDSIHPPDTRSELQDNLHPLKPQVKGAQLYGYCLLPSMP